jgi:GDP/UDP-N,N'-diacetylbacillosamine 2-epimerase (hydrolysing)
MSNKKIKVLVLTGKRGGFGAMVPMLRLLRDDSDIELQLVATDQHVSKKFGNTIDEVEQEFIVKAIVDMEQEGSSIENRAKALGVCSVKMSKVFTLLDPDLCILYGDRGEVLATAMVATTMLIPIFHIQGGDLSGSTDETMRHAITKLAHMHFPSNHDSYQRILSLGEEISRVNNVGDNHIDLITSKEFSSKEEVGVFLGLDTKKPIIIVLQHPETTEPEKSYLQMIETLEAVKKFNAQTVIVYPCSDTGHEGTIKAIDQYSDNSNFLIHKNLDAVIFWGLLDISNVMVGNSSSGIIESPSFGIPVVNIGRRQKGRLCSNNVTHTDCNRDKIYQAIKKSLYDKSFIETVKSCEQPYGNGKAGEKIVSIIKGTSINKNLIKKRMTY